MENKYYDLIISLIKDHRKYPGYESILEDIAKDVIDHSKVVLNTVSNEDVIISYLNKVIATSMVTVPKKMNINVKNRDSIVSKLIPNTTKTVVDQNILQDNFEQEYFTPIEDAINTDVNSEENTLEELLQNENLDEILTEEFEEKTELLEDNEIDTEIDDIAESTDIIEVPSAVTTESYTEEDKNNNDDGNDEEEVEEKKEEEEEEVATTSQQDEINKNFVDMMINGISNVEQKETEDEITEIYETLDEVETIDDNNNVENFLVDQEETVNNIVETEFETFIEDLELLDTSEDTVNIETEEKTEIITDTNFEDTSEVIDNEIQPLEIENIDTGLDFTDETDIESFEAIEDAAIEEFTATVDNINDIDNDLIEIEELDEELVQTSGAFNAPTFECFSYEPKKIEYDSEEIMSYLLDIAEKHPDKEILSICDLKYNQKLSVKEIADKLSFTEEEVIEVLNEIIDAVKD